MLNCLKKKATLFHIKWSEHIALETPYLFSFGSWKRLLIWFDYTQSNQRSIRECRFGQITSVHFHLQAHFDAVANKECYTASRGKRWEISHRTGSRHCMTISGDYKAFLPSLGQRLKPLLYLMPVFWWYVHGEVQCCGAGRWKIQVSLSAPAYKWETLVTASFLSTSFLPSFPSQHVLATCATEPAEQEMWTYSRSLRYVHYTTKKLTQWRIARNGSRLLGIHASSLPCSGREGRIKRASLPLSSLLFLVFLPQAPLAGVGLKSPCTSKSTALTGAFFFLGGSRCQSVEEILSQQLKSTLWFAGAPSHSTLTGWSFHFLSVVYSLRAAQVRSYCLSQVAEPQLYVVRASLSAYFKREERGESGQGLLLWQYVALFQI